MRVALVLALAVVTAISVNPAGVNAQQPGLASSGDLLVGVPEPADAESKSQNAIREGGRHFVLCLPLFRMPGTDG